MLSYARQAGGGEAPMPVAGVRIIAALPADQALRAGPRQKPGPEQGPGRVHCERLLIVSVLFVQLDTALVSHSHLFVVTGYQLHLRQ